MYDILILVVYGWMAYLNKHLKAETVPNDEGKWALYIYLFGIYGFSGCGDKTNNSDLSKISKKVNAYYKADKKFAIYSNPSSVLY